MLPSNGKIFFLFFLSRNSIESAVSMMPLRTILISLFFFVVRHLYQCHHRPSASHEPIESMDGEMQGIWDSMLGKLWPRSHFKRFHRDTTMASEWTTRWYVRHRECNYRNQWAALPVNHWSTRYRQYGSFDHCYEHFLCISAIAGWLSFNLSFSLREHDESWPNCMVCALVDVKFIALQSKRTNG